MYTSSGFCIVVEINAASVPPIKHNSAQWGRKTTISSGIVYLCVFAPLVSMLVLVRLIYASPVCHSILLLSLAPYIPMITFSPPAPCSCSCPASLPQSSAACVRRKPYPDADPLLLPRCGEIFGSLAGGQRRQLERHKMGHPGHARVWALRGSLCE